MGNNYAYDYRFVCTCGTEFETDDGARFDKIMKAHADCKAPENEALTLLTRLVTAVESIVGDSRCRYQGGKQ